MKKIVYLGIIMLALILFSCSKSNVEDVAKAHVKKQFRLGDTVKVDTSKLKYKVKKQGDTATVKVTGKIKYEEEIYLIKKGGKWIISEKTAPPAEQKKMVSHTQQKKMVSHTQQKETVSHTQQKMMTSPAEQKMMVSPEGHKSSHTE